MIADCHLLLRQAMKLLMSAFRDIELVGETGDGLEVVKLAQKHQPDVVLLDDAIPGKDSLDVVKEVCTLCRCTKVLIMTVQTTTHHATQIMHAGAHGLLSRMAGVEEVVEAIRVVRRGRIYLPDGLQWLFAEKYIRREERSPIETLSNREFQVMRLLALGYKNRDIARCLFISIKTVDTHRANILRKLSLRNNSDVTRFALKNNLVPY